MFHHQIYGAGREAKDDSPKRQKVQCGPLERPTYNLRGIQTGLCNQSATRAARGRIRLEQPVAEQQREININIYLRISGWFRKDHKKE